MHDTNNAANPANPAARVTHTLFILTIVGKGLLGLFQLAAAVGVYLGVLDYIPDMVKWVIAQGMAEGPHDVLVAFLLDMLTGVSASQTTFYITYFAAHGALHVAVVAAILWGAQWANKAAVLVLWGFVVFQMVEWLSVGGMLLLVLTAIDLVVIFLTLAENRAKRRAVSEA